MTSEQQLDQKIRDKSRLYDEGVARLRNLEQAVINTRNELLMLRGQLDQLNELKTELKPALGKAAKPKKVPK